MQEYVTDKDFSVKSVLQTLHFLHLLIYSSVSTFTTSILNSKLAHNAAVRSTLPHDVWIYVDSYGG